MELTKDLIKGLQCPHCGVLFSPLDKRKKYCSLKCTVAYNSLKFYHKKMKSNDLIWKANIKEKDSDRNKKRRASPEYRVWFRAYEQLYRERNRAAYRAKDAKRRAIELLALPLWADLTDIKDVYEEAKYFGYQVDHIIPLQNKLVCGLHVRDNLQLLSERENKSKGNYFGIE
jgi:hypothetical protein